jgi:copper transport protein
MRRTGSVVPALALALALWLAPSRALAHAAFVSAQPAPGQRLPTAPGVVALRFTEPINTRLSRVIVTGPDGQGFENGSIGQQDIQVRLLGDVAGVYEVSWTTVSLVDGHTLHGSYRFGVRVAPGAGAEGTTAGAPDRADLVVALARTLEDTGLLMAVGMLLVLHLARRSPRLDWVRVPLRLPLALAFASGLAVVAGEALLAAPAPSAGAIVEYLAGGVPGLARVIRLAGEAVALGAVPFGPGVVALPLMTALVALAAAGHAAAVRPAWFGIGADGLHLLAAGLWAGGILALATVRPPGGWRSSAARCLLDRFTPVALPAFVATVGFGVLRGIQELDGFGDLLSSSYGQVLDAKMLAVLAMLPLSLLAWRRRLARPRLEAAVAVVVIGAASLLAAYPLPPARAGEAEAAGEQPEATSALPREGDLTFGGAAGTVLVGLTLRPGEPGPNQVLVYLLPLKGEAAAADLPADLSVDGRSLSLPSCGVTCRSVQADLRGGEHLEVRVGGDEGGTAAFDLPSLPAPDGSTLLERVQERMHRLHTFRTDEVLEPAKLPLQTRYSFQAPDRLQIQASNGYAAVWVGPTRYDRSAPDAPWKAENVGISIPVPSMVWDSRDGDAYIGQHIIGTDTVDGVDAQVLNFLLQAGKTPLWFKLWVDADGLVHRAEMRAQGHFMDHRNYDFDAPFTLEAPAT